MEKTLNTRMPIAKIPDMPIKECQRQRVVVAVKSAVLGATIVMSPEALIPGEKRVIFTWREGFIIAKAKAEPELLRALFEMKKAFPGCELDSISDGTPQKMTTRR